MAAVPVFSSLVLPLMWLEQWEMLSPAWREYLSRLRIQWCHFITTKKKYIQTPPFIALVKKSQLEKKNCCLSEGKIVSALPTESKMPANEYLVLFPH